MTSLFPAVSTSGQIVWLKGMRISLESRQLSTIRRTDSPIGHTSLTLPIFSWALVKTAKPTSSRAGGRPDLGLSCGT